MKFCRLRTLVSIFDLRSLTSFFYCAAGISNPTATLLFDQRLLRRAKFIYTAYEAASIIPAKISVALYVPPGFLVLEVCLRSCHASFSNPHLKIAGLCTLIRHRSRHHA